MSLPQIRKQVYEFTPFGDSAGTLTNHMPGRKLYACDEIFFVIS